MSELSLSCVTALYSLCFHWSDRFDSFTSLFSIEQDTKVRDNLRLQTDAQNEIDMLEKQAVQEYEGLKDKIRENQGLLSANGEVIRITEDDAVSPIQTVQGNIRLKYDSAERDIERYQKEVINLQSNVTEKKALLQNHKGRLVQLQNRANNLDHEDGAVQKIARVVRAIRGRQLLLFLWLTHNFVIVKINALVREQRDFEEDKINSNSSPAEVLKFINEQIAELGDVLKDDQIIKVVKKMKKMVSDHTYLLLSPCRCELIYYPIFLRS